jgi:uncharacterized protein (TIGR00266 family)
MKYEIMGSNMQALKVYLNQGEKIYADSGKLVSKSDNVTMTPRMVGGIFKTIERKVTGASALLTVFSSESGEGHVTLAGVFPGRIVPIELGPGQMFTAEHYAFLAAEGDINFTMEAVNIGAAFFGGAGLLLQKFVGPGVVYLHLAGDITIHDLDGSQTLEVDPGHVAGFDTALSYKIRFVDNVRTALFGGVGLFLATFKGKGRVITHSVSRFKLSSEVYLEGLQQFPQKKQ